MTVRDGAETLIQDWLSEGRDSVTGALLTIDTIHHEVHEGELYTAEYTNTNVADAGTVKLVMTTGAKQPHFAFTVNAGGAVLVNVYEGATATGGTALAVFNNNRLSTNTPTASIVHTPSAGTAGTVLMVNNRYVPGGNSVQTRIGGAVRSSAEWALGTANKYMIDLINKSGGSITINAVLEWYEETV